MQNILVDIWLFSRDVNEEVSVKNDRRREGRRGAVVLTHGESLPPLSDLLLTQEVYYLPHFDTLEMQFVH